MVTAFISVPASRRSKAQVWWFQRQAEWSGSQPSTVLIDTEAPPFSSSCGKCGGVGVPREDVGLGFGENLT